MKLLKTTILLVALLTIHSLHTLGQTDKVYDEVEQMPSFPGGQDSLNVFLRANVKYPATAKVSGIQGRVVVSFIVECDGSLSDIAIASSIAGSLDREALRVVNSMPKWIPGKQNGEIVRTRYKLPISFRLK